MTDPRPDSTTPEPAPQACLSPEHLSRLAGQVADEGTDLPVGLDPDHEQVLIDLVRRRLRDRLLRYIARHVALDIHRSGGPTPRKDS